MRMPVRLILATTLALSALPAGAHAAVDSRCSATYTEHGQCTFFLAGGFLFISGSSNAYFVVVTVSDPTGNVGVFGCNSVRNSGGTQCASSVGLGAAPTEAQLPAGVPLTCSVWSTQTATGSFECYSSAL
jgi:hypothetical protein